MYNMRREGWIELSWNIRIIDSYWLDSCQEVLKPRLAELYIQATNEIYKLDM